MDIKKQDSHLPEYALVERQEMMRGIGYGDEAIARLQIGVVSSWGEINPAAIHLDRVVAAVKAGVWAAGGSPREFVISSICTSMAGNDNYHLPHRDLVASYIETVAKTNLFDGMVFVPVCDDVIPGHLMAAARLNLPSVAVTGGYMQLNRYKGEILDPLDIAPKYHAEFKKGKIDPPETFNQLSKETPFICDVAPSGSGEHLLGDFDEAGGIPSVMKELQPLLNTNLMTVTGNSLADNIEKAEIGNRSVIHSLDDPLAQEGGLVFLRGSLAPEGALIEQSAVPAEMFRHKGPARIFPTEEAACEALIADEISAGTIVIVRYMGPKGDPGMRLLQRFLWLLAAKGLQEKIAFLTDGRFSGTNKGCAVAHITPEAAEGGPLAVVKDGDIIEIDIPNEKLNLNISPEELKTRLDSWKLPDQKLDKGYLAVYSKMAKSADKGATLNYRNT